MSDHDRAPQAPRKRPVMTNLSTELYEDVRLIATQRSSSVSQAIRELVREGISRRKHEDAE